MPHFIPRPWQSRGVRRNWPRLSANALRATHAHAHDDALQPGGSTKPRVTIHASDASTCQLWPRTITQSCAAPAMPRPSSRHASVTQVPRKCHARATHVPRTCNENRLAPAYAWQSILGLHPWHVTCRGASGSSVVTVGSLRGKAGKCSQVTVPHLAGKGAVHMPCTHQRAVSVGGEGRERLVGEGRELGAATARNKNSTEGRGLVNKWPLRRRRVSTDETLRRPRRAWWAPYTVRTTHVRRARACTVHAHVRHASSVRPLCPERAACGVRAACGASAFYVWRAA